MTLELLEFAVSRKADVTSYDRSDGLVMTDEEWQRIVTHARLDAARPCWQRHEYNREFWRKQAVNHGR